jgi:hypothetical protein
MTTEGPTPSPSPYLADRGTRWAENYANAVANFLSANRWTWIVLVVLLAIAIFFILKDPDLFRIRTQPKTSLHYLWETIKRHFVEYLIIGGVFTIGSMLGISSLAAVALWGFLITTLGAFYAARADYSSNQALIEAKGTYNAVVQFADSLEMFNDKVRHELSEYAKREEHISIKFLTVIPAFGGVGLEGTYSNKRQYDPGYESFPEFVCNLVQRQLSSNRKWNIEILTHDSIQAKEWLTNIYDATKTSNADRDRKVAEKYQEQRNFVEKFADKIIISNYRRMRFWKASKLPNYDKVQRDNESLKIPFQFLLVKRFLDLEKEDEIDRSVSVLVESDKQLLGLFFLFSGDFLYDYVFKILQETVPMTELQQLTKGYYTQDIKLLKIFSNIFWNFSKNMDCLGDDDWQQFYP